MSNAPTPAYEVAAYYFPQFHPDPRNDQWHGAGWTEWEIAKQARPRFPGHRQPIVPAWGYFNEADPAWAAREIDLAAEHGVTTFLYDWYWYDGQPFLQDALEQGFLQAPNRSRLKFALMWANHDWWQLYPTRRINPLEVLVTGQTSPSQFAQLTEYAIEHYFTQPNYLLLDGAPYFSLFDLPTFLKGLGGLDPAREALADFRQRVRARGFPDLHLNAIVSDFLTLPGVSTGEELAEAIASLGFSSTGSYTWSHHYDMGAHGFPTAPYQQAAEANYQAWETQVARSRLPYYPNVSMGWDATPRTSIADQFERGEYPWFPVLEGNTPAAFEEALRHAQAFLDRSRLSPALLTINAWNEWTEGSYLLPDTQSGTAYLQAIAKVFASIVHKM